MKNKLLLFSVLLFSLFSQSALSQQNSDFNYPTAKRNAGNLIGDISKLFEPTKLPSFLGGEAPEATLITFDDVNTTGFYNSVEIAPNRYPGVSFYSPYPYGISTWATRSNSVSYPNSLIVGHICDTSLGTICSWHAIVIDFAQDSRDVAFWWGRDLSYGSGTIEVYTGSNYQLVANLSVGLPSSWTSFNLSQYTNVRRIILRHQAQSTPNTNGHIFIDNFQFTPITTHSPVGYFDSVSIPQAAALGWSVDPDNQSASNTVHCYIDNVFAGGVTANLPGTGVPYPGNHRFSLPIPYQYRNGVNHTINCYGLDTGGDPVTLLPGSPKTFKFNVPIGYLDSVSSRNENAVTSVFDGTVVGWSMDTDVPAQSNVVHFYVDGAAGTGVFAGQTVANIPRPDVNQQTGYPGDHGYEFSIPDQYRNGVQHTVYAYGIDLSGDQPKLLTGSPKTFILNPKVQTVDFEDINSPLSPNNVNDNPNLSIGKRIFPDKFDPNETNVNRRMVRIKSAVFPVQPNIEVFFKSFDLDDPSANTPPVDDDTGNNANLEDNRGSVGGSKAGQLSLSAGTAACTTTPPPGMFCSKTNANGIATADFTVTMNPGDNFAVATSSNQAYLGGISFSGINLKDSAGQTIPIGINPSSGSAVRTEMLTVWRVIHLEMDSLGAVQNNFWTGQFTSNVKVRKGTNNQITLPTALPAGEDPQDGILEVQGRLFKILFYDRTLNWLIIENTQGSFTISASPQAPATFKIYDDDDFDGDESLPGKTKNGDTGDDVKELPDKTLKLLQNADGLDALGEPRNVFAPAYIRPDYTWAANKTTQAGKPYNDVNVTFDVNVESAEIGPLINGSSGVPSPRDSDLDEKDDFWISYMLISYQGPVLKDLDPVMELTGGPWLGVTAGGYFADCLNSPVCPPPGPTDPNTQPHPTTTTVLSGSNGSLVFVETLKDYAAKWTVEGKRDEKLTAPHELGHTFGLMGDRQGMLWGIMGYPDYSNNQTASYVFHPEHLNFLRWRIKSPGK